MSDPTCDTCGAPLLDDEPADPVGAPEEKDSDWRVVFEISKGCAYLLFLALAIYCVTDSISCGYNDARHPYEIGDSYGAIALQHTPTYWIAYQLSKPRPNLVDGAWSGGSSCREDSDGRTHCTITIPITPACGLPENPCPLQTEPPHAGSRIHIHAKKVSGA
ncbi:MAG: hypothetical protein IAI48_00580 [Candidatus Eremiobacteraeota bacterium]|nr:hypothetical protein [Candidatus Eremiobacteraeota bacterium]